MSERLDQLTKFYESDPADTFLTYGIAMEYGKTGRYVEAIQWLDKTLALDPNYCYAYYQKAKMLGELGDDGAARTLLQQGLSVAADVGDDKAHGELNELLASL